MFEQLLQPFERYFSSRAADYALLLTGPWGCGKTHFIRNHLFQLAERNGLSPIYYSFSASEPLEAVIRHVLVSKLFGHSETRKEARIVETSSRAEIASVPPQVDRVSYGREGHHDVDPYHRLRLGDTVVFLDDLDRVVDGAAIPGIVGTVFAELVDRRQAKVVFSTNIQEVQHRFADFGRIREKYFRSIVSFKEDPHRLIEEYLRARFRDEAELLTYLIANVDLFVEVQKKIGLPNLRTVGYIADCFRWIYREKVDPLVAQALDRLFLTTAILSTEMSSGRISVGKTKRLQELSSAEWQFYALSRPARGGSDQAKSYSELFLDRYGRSLVGRMISVQIVGELALKGELDLSRLRTDLEKTLAQKPRHTEALDRLANFHELERSDIATLVREVLGYVEAGTYQLTSYPYIYSLLTFLRDRGYFTSIPADLAGIVKGGLPKAQIGDIALGGPDDTILSHRYDQTRPPDDNFATIVATIKDIVATETEKRTQHNMLTLLKQISDLPHSKFIDQYQSLPRDVLFSKLSPDTLANVMSGLSNLGIRRTEMILHDRITSISNASQFYYGEKATLESTATLLSSAIETGSYDETRRQRLLDLVGAIRRAAAHLEAGRSTPAKPS
jgi:hypothetical protein